MLLRALESVSVQELVRESGLSDETIYALRRGARISKGSRRLLEDALRKTTVRQSDRDSDATLAENGATAELHSAPAAADAFGPSATVAISRDQLMEWRGQLKVTLRWLRAIGESVQHIHDELGEATSGVAEILDSGVLPTPEPSPDRGGASRDEAVRIAAAAGIRPPDAPPAAASDR